MRDWEACYKGGETPWDRGNAAPPLKELFASAGAEIFGAGAVLVPGCGAGHDVRLLASKDLEVVGLDISPTAVRLASGKPKLGAETYEAGDFLAETWGSDRLFSAIWEHTCFCAIDPALRGRYAESAARVVAPGGVLAGVFYLTPEKEPGEECCPPFGVSVEELDECFAPWFAREFGSVPAMAYSGREGREWLTVYRRVAGVVSSC